MCAAEYEEESGKESEAMGPHDGAAEDNRSTKPPRQTKSPNKPHFLNRVALTCNSENESFSFRHSVCSSYPNSGGPVNHSVHLISPEDRASITLSEFVKSYSGSLPAEITVVEGANTSPVALCNEDILKVHRIKQQSMVLARANESQQYLIPFNAAIEFCVLYDPESNISKALKGYSFEKVSDLMLAEVRPKLVCARSSWEDKDTNRVVISNREVLVVREIILPKKKKGKKLVKLYSITKQTEKVVTEDCIANFSTKPSLLPLYLAEITGYIKDPFPCKAVLHDEGLMVPPHLCPLVSNLSGLVLTLVSMSTETVLATTYKREGIENPIIMDIPVELPQVKVKVLHISCQEPGEVDCIEEGSDQSGSEVDKSIDIPDDQSQGMNPIKVDQDEPYEVMVRAANVNASIKNILELRSRGSNISTTQPVAMPEILGPEQLIKQYSHVFPVQVKIVEGYQNAGTCLLVDEIYKVHIVTTTDGISMMDNTGYLVLVPTDSSTQFGVIFNPHADLEKAVRGYTFESVQDVVRATQLPRVMCATQSYKSSSPASSVEEGEVLVVNDAEIILESNVAVLTVYSIREGMAKKLQGECKGYFTTDPSRILLHANAIIQHLHALLPTCAMMYPGRGGDAISEPAVVTLLQYHSKSALVATTVSSPKRDWNPYRPVEIPLVASVKIVVIPDSRGGVPNYEMQAFSKEEGGASFAPLERKEIAPLIVPRRPRVPKKDAGPPVAAARYRKADNSVAVATRLSRYSYASDDAEQQPHKDETASKPPAVRRSVAQELGYRQNFLVDELSVSDGPQFVQDSETNISQSYPGRLEMLSRDVAELVKQFSALAKQFSNMERRLEAIDRPDEGVRMRDDQPREPESGSGKNKFVESLTSYQVLHLLDAAGLGMYSEAFDREKIDGRLLCILNDSVLQRDLNVTSELHRLKLLGIISGAVDVRGWFTYPMR